MRETSKCHKFRLMRGDFDNYLHGKGIDIGAGRDPLRIPNGDVRAWDKKDGNAQLMPGVPAHEYDFVYSSHCLEHMCEVPEAIGNWCRILKPHGYLYIVVPDYLLYEKLTWPSRFNADHKQSFSSTIERSMVNRPNHWHIAADLCPVLQHSGMELVKWFVESWNFDYNAGICDQTTQNAVAQIFVLSRKGG